MSSLTSIKKQLVVHTSQSVAFEVFTHKMDLWWPRSHHIGKSPMTRFVIEPKAKGRWYSIHEDGSECEVGRVLEWQPSDKLVLGWQINSDFQYDPKLLTEVEVNFIAENPQKTLVKFEHRNLDRFGPGGGKTIESMDMGWGMILDLFGKRATGDWTEEANRIYSKTGI